MRPQKINDTELINRLFTVLRTKGYDGASLNDLASASGLQKASLYHRFPGGKKDIVLAVLNHIGEWTQQQLITIVENPHTTPLEKLTTILDNINNLYQSGNSPCITQTLSMENSALLFSEQLKEGIKIWLNTFSKLAIEFGKDTQTSNEIANQVIIQIQGSLILSKAINTTNPFSTALQTIKKLYIA